MAWLLPLNNNIGRLARLISIAAMLMTLTFLSGCKTDQNYFVAQNASGGGDDSGAPTLATGFRVRYKAKTGVDAFLHKFGDVNAPCEIPRIDVDNPTQIDCMLNMMEYDLWFHGFEYELNVPEGYCSYIEERPYTYYRLDPGFGPAIVSLTTVNGSITACTVNGAPALSFNAGSCDTGEGTVSPAGAFRCAYNYSLADPASLPNCCAGATQVTLTATNTLVVPNTTVITSTTIENGGRLSNCTDSPHKYILGWPQTIPDLQPATVIVELGNASLVRTQKIPSQFAVREQRPINTSNSFSAGFSGWTEYVANPANWQATRTIPRPFAPVRDRGPAGDHSTGSGLSAIGDGSFQFSCKGPAGELRHQVRLYVNEWNTIEDYQAFKAGGSAASVDPTRTGTAGVDCSSVNTGFSCNSFWGFEDLINEYGAGAAGTWDAFPGFYWATLPP